MEHIMQFAISIDDDAITRMVKEKAESAIVRDIRDRVESEIFGGKFYGKYMPSALNEMVTQFLEDNQDRIIAATAENLAARLARTKRGKAILDNFDVEK